MIVDVKAKADELLNFIKSGKQVHDMFAEKFKHQYLLNGKTIAQWEAEFKIKVPSGMGSPECKALDEQLMELYQRATFNKASASATLQALTKGSESEYRTRFESLTAEYKQKNEKLPANATLNTLIQAQLNDVDSAVMSAELADNFWGDVIKHLDGCRKLVENITINLGIEAKLR